MPLIRPQVGRLLVTIVAPGEFRQFLGQNSAIGELQFETEQVILRHGLRGKKPQKLSSPVQITSLPQVRCIRSRKT